MQAIDRLMLPFQYPGDLHPLPTCSLAAALTELDWRDQVGIHGDGCRRIKQRATASGKRYG